MAAKDPPEVERVDLAPSRKEPWEMYSQVSYENQRASGKHPHPKEETLVERQRRRFEDEGLRRTVLAVMLVHVEGHPHVLALQNTKDSSYSLPGGMIQPGEAEKSGLCRKLRRLIRNPRPGTVCEWQVGDVLSMWWRPNFGGPTLPYLPPHVTRPVEQIRVFKVTLPRRCLFLVPPSCSLVAVSFFDVFADPQTYGQIVSSIPPLVSKFVTVCYDAD